MIQLIAGSKVFYSAILKMIVGNQEAISPYSLHEISLSNTSLEVEIDLEDEESKRFKD